MSIIKLDLESVEFIQALGQISNFYQMCLNLHLRVTTLATAGVSLGSMC